MQRKQLITVGGLLQALYTAAFTFSALKDKVPDDSIAFIYTTIIFCAAKGICILPLKMEAYEAYKLFKAGLKFEISDEELNQAMIKWCDAVENLVEQKRRWLHRANMSFLVSSVMALIILVTSLLIYQHK